MIAVVLAALAVQEMPAPGKEHAWLKGLEGTWDVHCKFYMAPDQAPMEMKGVETARVGLGGFWLTAEFKGEMSGTPFEGRTTLGSSPFKKKYVGTWIDSMSPHPVTMEGTYDERTKTITSTGDGVGMDGNPVKVKGIQTFKDDDTMTFVMHEGKDANSLEEVFSIEYKRRK